MSLVNFLPNEDRVLVFPFALAKVSKGGLHIPDTVDNKPYTGRVVAVGPGKLMSVACKKCGDSVIVNTPMPEVGQLFVFPPMAGTEITLDGVLFRIIRASDLHGADPEQFDASCPEVVKALEESKEKGIEEPVPAQQ